MKSFENLISRNLKTLSHSQMFPYNKISLNRKRYSELLFDFERKKFRRTQIQKSLKSILTNKHRK